jgi:glycosyltransferase involved in cell wall biosynthesis
MTGDGPRVSVCIPTFNRCAMLREALQSVFRQTFRDFETIVVDDGSTDGTSEMLAVEYGGAVRAIRQSNAGDGSARNRAVREARGGLIAFLDSDDLWVPEKLERQVRLLDDRPEVAVVYSPKKTVDMHGREIHPPRRTCYRGQVTGYLFADVFIATPSVVCRRELFTRVGLFSEQLKTASDYDFWLRASIDHAFDYVAEPLVICRRHGGNLSQQRMLENQQIQLAVLEEFYGIWRGNPLLPEKVARRRLARESFKLARHYLRAGQKPPAHRYYRQALHYRFGVRSLFGWLVTAG